MRLSALYIEKIQEAQQVGRQKGRQEGRTEGRTEEGQALILRQLTRQVGNVSIEAESQVKALSLRLAQRYCLQKVLYLLSQYGLVSRLSNNLAALENHQSLDNHQSLR